MLSIGNNMRRWWAKNQEATLEDLPHQAWSVRDLQGRHRRTAENEGQWTEVVRLSMKGLKRRIARRAIAVQDDGTLPSSDKSGLSSQRFLAQVLNQVSSATLIMEYHGHSSFIVSGTYNIVCFSGSHVTSSGRHPEKDTQLVRGCIWNS